MIIYRLSENGTDAVLVEDTQNYHCHKWRGTCLASRRLSFDVTAGDFLRHEVEQPNVAPARPLTPGDGQAAKSVNITLNVYKPLVEAAYVFTHSFPPKHARSFPLFYRSLCRAFWYVVYS
jgi:hypothetical protein